MILLYSFPKKGKGTPRVSGFDALSSPCGPGKSVALTPKGNIPDNFKSGISVDYEDYYNYVTGHMAYILLAIMSTP